MESDTRAACCMLCVTITMVYSFFSSDTNSSIFIVEIGSSAEQGSSISKTSGSTASKRAIQSRCCCPPDIAIAEVFKRSLTSSHKAERVRLLSTMSSSFALLRSP